MYVAVNFMEKLYQKIEKYLIKEFPKRLLCRVNSFEMFNEEPDIYGLDSMKIEVIEENEKLYYKLVK